MAVPFVTEIEVEYGRADEVAPRVRRVIAKNPSKFTFTGTGTYVLGDDSLAIIDPGPDDDAHVESVLRCIGESPVSHLLITHTHGDHSPATAQLQPATGATTYGFGPHPAVAVEESADPWADEDDEVPEEPEEPEDEGAPPRNDPAKAGSDRDFVPDTALAHGARFEAAGFGFEALHTPGHISNHLCFVARPLDGGPPSLFTGDHIMGWSTTIIPPPDGSLAAYMASLDVVLLLPDLDTMTLFPTHGPPITDPRPFVEALRDHRNHRTDQILGQLAAGPATITELVRVMYADVHRALHKPARRSVWSHIAHLIDTGAITHDGDSTLEAPPLARYDLAD